MAVLHGSAAELTIPAEPLTRLASPDFKQREAAQADLLQWGREHRKEALKLFLNRHHHAPDPEVRERCRDILRDLVCDDYWGEGEGYIGISMADFMQVGPDGAIQTSVRVSLVQPKSPAQTAGLLVGDLIVAIDGTNLENGNASSGLMSKIKATKPRTRVTLKVARGAQTMEVPITLARRPPAADQQRMFGQPTFDFEASEREAKDAFFRQWLEAHPAGS